MKIAAGLVAYPVFRYTEREKTLLVCCCALSFLIRCAGSFYGISNPFSFSKSVAAFVACSFFGSVVLHYYQSAYR